MASVRRLVTTIELDPPDGDGCSAWAHLYAELSDGRRHLLLDDRGWGGPGSTPIAHDGREQIEATARMVVGPDGPGPGETDEEMADSYWSWMETWLREAGIAARAAELRHLPHDVEIGAHLREQIAEMDRA